MRPDQLDLLAVPSTPTLHPSGDRAVVSVLRPDETSDEYAGQLWVVPTDGSGPPRRLTRGHRDTAPRYAPDGRLLAFLRAAPGDRAQLHVVAADGGEPVRVTDLPLGAGEPRWSPDGRSIAFVTRVPEPGRYGTAEGVGPDAEAPRLFSDLRYLEDGLGYAPDRRRQVFVVDVPELDAPPSGDLPVARQVTEADTDSSEVAWSRDGGRLALVSARHEGRVTDLRSDAWTCAPDGGDLTRVTDTSLSVEQVAFDPDGERLWLLASDPGPSGVEFLARHTGLWSVPLDGSAAPVRHTDAETLDLGDTASPLTAVPDGVLVQSATRGRVELLLVPRDGGAPRTLVGGPRWTIGADATPTARGLAVVASVSTPGSSGELVAVAPGEERVLTDLSAGLRAAGVRPLRELTVRASDGYPVHGWVVLPGGDGPHPVLLDIHGGPFAQYGWHVHDEAQVLAGAGYAVLLPNPRGSSGYGQEHGRVVQAALGGRDADDVLDYLDGAVADPSLHLDQRRAGVLGGSYGGYLTASLIAHPRSADRFAAAIVERGFLDPETFAGTSDIGWFFGDAYVGTDPERVRAQSPMAAVDRVATPTLVIHSERDLRCPLEQGQRYFAALQRRGVPSEFLVFPGESHGLTRTGRPRHRRQRFEHVLRWWARHLPVTPAPTEGETSS